MSLWTVAESDCILVMGSNMAENHPVGFRFVVEAKDRGATIIHVDPRFTRTSALADIYAPMRSGGDIAFLGGIIRYLLANDLWFRDYAMAYTNIATIIDPRYRGPDELDGFFSGWSDENRDYAVDTWQYDGEMVPSPLAERHMNASANFEGGTRRMAEKPPRRDETLQDPNCVYQIMRRHYDRYTPEMVEQITGCPRETFIQVCETLAKNSGRERTGAMIYAVGWTHHTVGVQIIRAGTIIQGLLGNMGRPGGGILALRGHTSIQGSTDIPTLSDMLPTYLPQPSALLPHKTLKEYLETETAPTGWWHNFPKYAVSLLKAWYGAAATASNDYCYDHLPKMTGDHSQLPMTLAMVDGAIKGLFVLGQNPLVGSVNANLVRQGLRKLDWMVIRDMAMVETAEFWADDPDSCGSEVFFMPCALAGEKDGTVTNTNRLVQWHDAVLEAPGDSRSDLWFMYHLGRMLKDSVRDGTEPRDQALRDLTWEYPVRGERAEPDAEAVLREINGYTVADRKQVPNFIDLKDDGSTACGGWAYCAVYPRDGHNVARSRIPDPPGGAGSHLGWAFAWPSNRRELYNRASSDPSGKPWSERKKLVWWNEADGRWTGNDVPDFEVTKRPDYRPDWSRPMHGMDAIAGDSPFIMIADGKSMLFGPAGIKDGPLPTHFEPPESPVRNQLYSHQINPAAKMWGRPGNEFQEVGDPAYPHVFTTYRLTELHCGGIGTRIVPHTAELQPEAFVEIPTELAKRLRIASRDWVVLSTRRAEIEVRALVTDRLRPFRIDGREVFQVGMPWVYGPMGFATGASANDLLAIYGDANVSIHSTKALSCALRKGRLHG